MRVTGVSRGLIFLLVCGAVAAVPIDGKADWHDQYGTVVYAGNGGASGGWTEVATNGSWGSSGGGSGSTGGSWGSSGGDWRARRMARRARRHGSSGGSYGSAGGSWRSSGGSYGSWGR
jgi:hypothetical protein